MTTKVKLKGVGVGGEHTLETTLALNIYRFIVIKLLNHFLARTWRFAERISKNIKIMPS